MEQLFLLIRFHFSWEKAVIFSQTYIPKHLNFLIPTFVSVYEQLKPKEVAGEINHPGFFLRLN
jgi:hypothetical protein